MIGKIVRLAVFLLIANALYRVAPAWLHYYEFRDSLKELALFSTEKTDAALVDHVMRLADEKHVPIAREDVQISRTTEPGGQRLSIAGQYVELLKVVPGYTYRWDVSVDVGAVRVAPPTATGR